MSCGGEGGSWSTVLFARVRAAIRHGVSAVMEFIHLLFDELVPCLHELGVLSQSSSLGSCTMRLRWSKTQKWCVR